MTKKISPMTPTWTHAITRAMLFVFIMTIISCATIATAFSASTPNYDTISLLKVDFVSQQPDPVEPGSYVDLRWRITNVGGKSADYTFELSPEYPFSFDNQKDAKITSASISSYQATQDGAILYYRLRVADNAIEGTDNKVKLYYYKADSGTPVRSLVEQAIRIESKQGLINIDRIKINPEQVKIGTVFNVSFDVENFGSNFISNLKVSLGDANNGVVPLGSSNQRTLSMLAGKSRSKFTYQYFVDSSAKTAVATIPVTATYYDSLGRANTVTTNIGVKISADPSFFPNLDSSSVFLSDTKGKIVVGISNTGKSDINFAVLELLESPDYVVVGPTTSYLGNLKSDDLQTGQFDVYVKPTTQASVPLQFKLSYKDAYDQPQVATFSLNNKIYTPELATKVGLIAPTSYSGLVILVLIIVAVVGFIWYRRRKKAANKSNRA